MLQVLSDRAWRLGVVLLMLYVLLRLLERITVVVFAVIAALLITALLRPAVSRLRGIGLRHSAAAILVFVLGIAGVAAAGWFVVGEVSSNAAVVAGHVSEAVLRIRQWLSSGPLHLSNGQLNALITDVESAFRSNRAVLASGALSTATSVTKVLAGVLLTLFTTFFLLRDGERIWLWIVRLFPARFRGQADAMGLLAWRSLGGYVRGIVVVALADALTMTVVLSILRVPLAVPLGVLIFLGAFIPLVGLTVTGSVAVLVSLVSRGPGTALIVLVAMILAVQVEGHVLQPLILSRAVRLHPLAIVLCVATGALMAGIGGALVAVPLLAVLNNVVRNIRNAEIAPAEHVPVSLDRHL
jgi:predicted PurR-regulated permease PerM